MSDRAVYESLPAHIPPLLERVAAGEDLAEVVAEMSNKYDGAEDSAERWGNTIRTFFEPWASMSDFDSLFRDREPAPLYWMRRDVYTAVIRDGLEQFSRNFGGGNTDVLLVLLLACNEEPSELLRHKDRHGQWRASEYPRLADGDHELVRIVYKMATADTNGPSWERPHNERTVGDVFIETANTVTDAGLEWSDALETAWLSIVKTYDDEIARTVQGIAAAPDTAVDPAVVVLDDTLTSEPSWTVDGFLVRGELVLLAAPAFAGKTPLALALAGSVATGRQFLGRPTQQGKVLYLTREASHSVLRGWLKRLGHDLGDLRDSLLVMSHPSMAGFEIAAGGNALADLIAKHGPFVLVVVDTLSRFTFGNENLTETYTEMHRNTVEPISQRFGSDAPTLVFLDHMSNDKSENPRGATAKLDMADTAWILKRTAGRRDADITRHELRHNGRTRIIRPGVIGMVRTFDADGMCQFTPSEVAPVSTDDEAVAATVESALLAALPAGSNRKLEDAVRQKLGDGFARNEFRDVLARLVSTGDVVESPGPNRSTSYVRGV